jgi:predicted dinucleotide-binding enzyme
MKVGIIGSGHIGGTAAKLLVEAEYEVAISNSRGPDSLKELVGSLGQKARAATVEEASRFGEVVLLAIPFKSFRDLDPSGLSGKVVIDAGNYYPQRDGRFQDIDSGSKTSTEVVATHLMGSKVVKAFNTIYYQHLANYGDKSAPLADRFAIFLAGDDAGAKTTVAKLIADIGFAPVDTGTLHEGGAKQQPGSPIYNRPMKSREAQTMMKNNSVTA